MRPSAVLPVCCARRKIAGADQHRRRHLADRDRPANHEAYALVHGQNAVGDLRKIVVRDGHQGPKEIGCSAEFLEWLTHPVLNGGGALCEIHDGRSPISANPRNRRIRMPHRRAWPSLGNAPCRAPDL